jgi:hypothetical protein
MVNRIRSDLKSVCTWYAHGMHKMLHFWQCNDVMRQTARCPYLPGHLEATPCEHSKVTWPWADCKLRCSWSGWLKQSMYKTNLHLNNEDHRESLFQWKVKLVLILIVHSSARSEMLSFSSGLFKWSCWWLRKSLFYSKYNRKQKIGVIT